MKKHLLIAQRARRLPPHWSWIDHRLVREGHLSRCSPRAWTLYLFLVSVGDAQGLSYYSDRAVCRLVGLEPAQLQSARDELIEADLVAYQRPLYQVLDLGLDEPGTQADRAGTPLSLGQLLRRAVEQADQGGSRD